MQKVPNILGTIKVPFLFLAILLGSWSPSIADSTEPRVMDASAFLDGLHHLSESGKLGDISFVEQSLGISVSKSPRVSEYSTFYDVSGPSLNQRISQFYEIQTRQSIPRERVAELELAPKRDICLRYDDVVRIYGGPGRQGHPTVMDSNLAETDLNYADGNTSTIFYINHDYGINISEMNSAFVRMLRLLARIEDNGDR